MSSKGRYVPPRALWLPPGVRPQTGVMPFPSGDIVLPDGRILYPMVAPFAGGKAWMNDPDNQTASHCMRVIGSVDSPEVGAARGKSLVHLSVSYSDHLPTWDDLHMVRDALTDPKVDFMMVLPRQDHYVNVHPWTLHLWMMPFEWESV